MKTSLWMTASTCAVLLLASPSASSQPAADGAAEPSSSKSVERGSVHFQRGVAFYKEGNFAAALVEFKRANQLAPNYRLLFNIGQSYFELHDYVSALRSFEDYLEAGGADVRPARRAEVEEDLRTLRGRVASLTVRSNLSGSELLIDDVPSGVLPLSGPVLISAGRHLLAVRKNGAVLTSRVVEVSGADSVVAELSAAVSEPAPLAPSSSPSLVATPASGATAVASAPPRGMSTAFWVSLTCASALAVGTATTGVLALGARDELDRRLTTYPGSATDIDSSRAKVKQLALITDILGGVAVAAAAATIVFALWNPSGEKAVSSAGLVARVGLGGVVLEHRF